LLYNVVELIGHTQNLEKAAEAGTPGN